MLLATIELNTLIQDPFMANVTVVVFKKRNIFEIMYTSIV